MRRGALPTAAVLAVLLSALGGCLIESTLDADGSGTMKVSFRAGKDQTLDQQKKNFASPNVTILNATMDDEKHFTIELKYKDLTKLSSSGFFRSLVITTSTDAAAGTKTVVAKQVNRNPSKLADDVIKYFGDDVAITFTFPGEVVKTNASEHKDKTATWKMTLTRMLGEKEIPFEVTYKVPKS